jgi:hypothetical protein
MYFPSTGKFTIGGNPTLTKNLFSTGTQRYLPMVGVANVSASDANTQYYAVAAMKASGLAVVVIANASTTDATLTLCKNGVATSIVVTIPAGQTGLFVSTGDEVELDQGDYITCRSEGATSASPTGYMPTTTLEFVPNV